MTETVRNGKGIDRSEEKEGKHGIPLCVRVSHTRLLYAFQQMGSSSKRTVSGCVQLSRISGHVILWIVVKSGDT